MCVFMQGSETAIFPCEGWLARSEEDGETIRELVPSDIIVEKLSRDGTLKVIETEVDDALESKCVDSFSIYNYLYVLCLCVRQTPSFMQNDCIQTIHFLIHSLPGNQTHDTGVASTMHYYLSYRKTIAYMCVLQYTHIQWWWPRGMCMEQEPMPTCSSLFTETWATLENANSASLRTATSLREDWWDTQIHVFMRTSS